MPERRSFLNLKKKPVSKKKDIQTSVAGLIESRFCYGCLNFSVDYPETSEAMHWCLRYESDGIRYKRILPEFIIRQCPGKNIE